MFKPLTTSAVFGVGMTVIAIASGWHLSAGNTPAPLVSNRNGDNDLTFTLESLNAAKQLFMQGHAEEALEIVVQHESGYDYTSDIGSQWIDLHLQVATELALTKDLLDLYVDYPEAFKKQERASLLVADAFIADGNINKYRRLRKSWQGNDHIDDRWHMLDVDAALLSDERALASALLQKATFTGASEVDRLVRIAFLKAENDPKGAFEFLEKASEVDPNNSDIYIYRAQLLESIGEVNSALQEFSSALHVDPENVFLKDLLADFYLRHGHYQQAMKIWLSTLENQPLDTILLKSLFWSRMVAPVNYDWALQVPPVGKLHALNSYLLELPEGRYWDDNAFATVSNAKNLLATQQATFWLRLLDLLKNDDEEGAFKLIYGNRFGDESWDPQLLCALKQLLQYRSTGKFAKDEAAKGGEPKYSTGDNAFFAFLDSAVKNPNIFAQNQSLKVLLNSKEAFVVAFISAGWLEAGLHLFSDAPLTRDLPTWVAVALTEAIYSNRGPEQALKFVVMQPYTQELGQLAEELVEVAKNNNSLLYSLRKMSSNPSEEGARASWLLSRIYIERESYSIAREVVYSHPELAKSILGKETLARIAMQVGDLDEVDTIYEEISESSLEAKSYLARKAYNEKNWHLARLYTKELIAAYPDNETLRDNLQKIAFEEESSL